MSDMDKNQLLELARLIVDEKEHVDHPSHYNQGQIEVIDYIEDLGWGEEFCAGNAIKYISRYKYKDKPLQDLQKAKWYVERLISYYENKTNK
jgi:hypothetical protein